jgi:predicted enzyme related to lactoylglutathione lyase
MGKNQVCYWELASNDAGKSVAFFEKVFGWEMQLDDRLGIHELPSGDTSGGFHGGGIFTLRKAKLPFLTVYIQVDDIEERARAIEEAGGLLVEPPFELPTGSKICLFNDPSGVTFAMLQPARKE